MNSFKLVLTGLLMSTMAAVSAADALSSIVQERVAGDRSGVCLVATWIGAAAEHAAACADAENTRALDADSRFEIGSISKALQGLLVASLVEAGELDLDTPLREILPAGTPLPDSADAPIRLIHLLTHTSGLPRLPADFAPADINNPYADYDSEALLASLANTSLSTPPGEAFAYSNLGAMTLSHALMVHTGQPLHVLFKTRVFDPLGMDQTAMGGTTVQGHDNAGQPVANWDFSYNLGGAGAIRSTPADMALWLTAILQPAGSPIEAALIRSRGELINAGGQRVGYGWLHLPLNDRFILAHDGGTGGFSSFAAIDLERERAALLLMDTSMVIQNSLSDLALHLIDPVVPLGQPQRPRAAAEGEMLQDYVGRFALYQGDEPFMGDFVLEFTVDRGELLLQGSVGGQVQPQIPLASEGNGRFTIDELGLAVEFVRNASGQVDALGFKQGPLDLRGERQ